MEKEMILNNGTEYKFIEIFPNFISSYCKLGGEWNHISKNFHRWDEVDAWVEKMNAPKTYSIPVEMSANEYYSITGYYGD